MTLSELGPLDMTRVCRDLAWSEITQMPAMVAKLGARCSQSANIDWSAKGVALDSLSRMQLATAAATWCNAFDTGYEDLFLAKRNAADWAVAMQRVAELGGKHLTFASSGSTGARKHIRHQLSVLMQEAQVWANLLKREQANDAFGMTIKRVVVLVPTHHIYGFIWGVLLPKALQVPALDADLQDMPMLLPGDLVVAVPDQWAWLANTQCQTQRWPDGVKGVTSTAPLPPQTHRQLTTIQALQDKVQKAPLSQLLHIYGSAETAGLAWRDDPESPYNLADGRVRSLAGGIALQAYDDSPIDLAVQDELAWVDQQRFQVVARLDHCVQVGGHNVSPEWVSTQLASHPGVAHCAVRLCSLADQPRLKAFIVLKHTNEPQLQSEIEAWAAENLPWYATPCAFTYGISLPRNTFGKLCNWPD
jgi:long-chain acyl-CoA synthetase